MRPELWPAPIQRHYVHAPRRMVTDFWSVCLLRGRGKRRSSCGHQGKVLQLYGLDYLNTKESEMNGGCRYCGNECGEREFCDETCWQEFSDELACMEQEIAEELPGESRYAAYYEPEEWDVVGGL